MIKFKKFDSNAIPSQEEFQAAMPKRGGGKIFRPGEYDLEIVGVEDCGASRNDDTWINVGLTLAGEGKTIKTWIDVPTTKLTYNHGEGSNKNVYSAFLNLQSFVRALGGELEPEESSLNEVLPALFSDPETLKGQTVKVYIGFYASHIAMNEDKEYFIADRNGAPIDDVTYEDRDVAEMEAASQGLYIQKFPRILKFLKQED